METKKVDIELMSNNLVYSKPQSPNKLFLHMKDLRYRLGLDLLILMIINICFLMAGAIGMIIYGVFTKERGPVYLRNNYIGLWLCSLIVFYGFQVFYSLLKCIKNNKKAFHVIEIVYFVGCNLALSMMIICYIMATKIDAVIWSMVIVVENCSCIFVLVLRRKRENSNSLETNFDEEVEKNKNKQNCLTRCCSRNFFWINIILRVIFFIFLALLANGSVFIGGMTAT
jgi:hypothetical protein